MFIPNKYTRIYFQLVYKRKITDVLQKVESSKLFTPDNYCEGHHIIPKSLGGDNHFNNKVLFKWREHKIAHKLLVKMCEGQAKVKMKYAFIRMTKSNYIKYKLDVKITDLDIALAKMYNVEESRKRMLGVPKTAAQKRKNSISSTGRVKTKEEILKRIATMRLRGTNKWTEEQKQRRRGENNPAIKNRGKIWVYNSELDLVEFINEKDLQTYISLGYKRGWNKVRSVEHKQRISLSKKSKNKKHSPEHIAKCIRRGELNGMYEKNHTVNTRLKMGTLKKNRIWIKNLELNIMKMIWPSELDSYVILGYSRGKLPFTQNHKDNISKSHKRGRNNKKVKPFLPDR